MANPNKFKIKNQRKNWDPKKNDPIAIQKVVNNVIARGIKIVEERTKKKKLTSDSEESESKIDGSEEHQDHEVVA